MHKEIVKSTTTSQRTTAFSKVNQIKEKAKMNYEEMKIH